MLRKKLFSVRRLLHLTPLEQSPPLQSRLHAPPVIASPVANPIAALSKTRSAPQVSFQPFFPQRVLGRAGVWSHSASGHPLSPQGSSKRHGPHPELSCLHFSASPCANLRFFVFISNRDQTGVASQTPRWLQSSLPVRALWYSGLCLEPS